MSTVKKQETKKAKIKLVTKDMPIAVALMILIGDKELRKTRIAPEYKERLYLILEPLESELNHLTEDIFRNNNIHLKDDDDIYKRIYENRGHLNFANLIEYLRAFYEDDMTISHINSYNDVKSCYQLIEKHQTQTANTTFSPDFCWEIARIFLNGYSALSNSKEEFVKYIKSYEDAKDTYPIRKQMVKNARGSVYIAGTTLKDAFSTSNANRDSAIIQDLFQNDQIKNIYIFILNYKYMGINQESASKEIETSLTNVMDMVLKADDNCPNVEIIMLNSFNIPFALLANDELLTRSTYIFSYKRNYRGQFLLFDSNDLEYKSIKHYLDILRKNAYELDMSPKAKSPDVVKEKYRQDEIAYRQKGLIIKKIHPAQLENLVKASFTYPDNKKKAKDMSSFPIPNEDTTQTVLLPYLAKTEELLDELVRLHDPYGWAKVIPCNDLGFPNNIMRIAGGFLTGAYYNWSCTVPIVPVDATINTCTSSVFKLKGFDADTLNNEAFETIVKNVCVNAMETGYAFSFESGNHFLMISKDKYENYYLVLHCSAKQAKESCFGLYPSEQVWYKDKIKTLYSKDQTRYIRYIRSDTAVKFVDYANRFRDFNEEMHQYIAEEFASEVGAEIIGQPNIKHHYGMPTPNSISIGTFAVDIMSTNDNDLIVPVFSDLGKDICIYSVSRKQEHTYAPSGTSQRIVLVPHGWGQVIDGIKSMRVDNVNNERYRQLIIETDNRYPLDVTPQNRISIPEKRVRLFESVSSFLLDKCSNISGEVQTVLHPVFCFCSRTVHSKNYFLDNK